jgi:AraC-like DNA-binding protein
MVATIKVRNFHAVKEVLETFGVVPADALGRVGLAPNLFANKENVVLYADAVRLVAECARLTNCDDFGLRVGMRQGALAMGLTGLLSLSAMKVGEALQFIVAGLKTSDTGGVFAFEARKGSAFLSYIVVDGAAASPEHLVDGAMAIACNTLRQFCGADWRPDRVALIREPPRDPKPFRQIFGAPVEFGASAAHLACPAAVLNQTVASHNAQQLDILIPLFDTAVSQSRGDLVSTVRGILKAQVRGGRLTRARVAQALGLTEHVLVYRLNEANVTFSVLAEEVKYELARQMLRAGRELRAIAGELGFADASAFSRAFVKWSGETPGRWRADRARMSVAENVSS